MHAIIIMISISIIGMFIVIIVVIIITNIMFIVIAPRSQSTTLRACASVAAILQYTITMYNYIYDM